MLRPYSFVGVSIPVTVNSPPGAVPLPGLRLPRRRRRLGAGAGLSFVLHAGIIALVALQGRALLDRAAGRPGRWGGGGGAEGRPAVNFFTLPPAAPAAITVPPVPRTPRVTAFDFRALRRIPVDVPPVELPREAAPPAGGPGAGRGTDGGQGMGTGAGAGADVGPGTGGEGGYIFVASPRTAILPPLAKVPGSVAGRTYQVRFWVSAEGRVTRVEVEPPIADAGYSREFQQRMMAYQFYPARTRDGRNVASVVTVPLRIGN